MVEFFLRWELFFDSVVIAPAKAGQLDSNPDAVDWIRMAYKHLKVVGFTQSAAGVLAEARVPTNEEGIHDVSSGKWGSFIEDAKRHRIWSREEKTSQ
jgi:catalase